MKIPRPYVWVVALAAMALSSAAQSAETWFCEYTNYRHTGTDQSWFRVEGDRVIENSGDAIVSYHLLEDSKTAIVATKGGSYASDPWVMGFLLMIRKETGQFAMVTAPIGSETVKQTGQCHLSGGQNSN